jgi:leucyl/phenylalanyl-tRNA---protein transferase
MSRTNPVETGQSRRVRGQAIPAPEAADRRTKLFRESFFDAAERWILGTVWALMPNRIGGVPALVWMWLVHMVHGRRGLPDTDEALTRPTGLCGIVDDFSSPTIIEAYRRSLFPFAHCGPLKWWSPPRRCVLYFDEVHIAKRLRRQLRQQRYRVTFDTDFEGVIKACAGRRKGKWHLNWITPRIMRAFAALFDEGHAHSFEVWNEDNQLVGGGYGLAIGRVFFTESQFSSEPNTSKIGFMVLNWHLARWGFVVNDGKDVTPTIDGMGFREVSRAELRGHLAGITPEHPGRWSVETDLATVADWHPGAAPAKAA